MRYDTELAAEAAAYLEGLATPNLSVDFQCLTGGKRLDAPLGGLAPMVVVDGPDGAGKSTACRTLQADMVRRFGCCLLVHASAPRWHSSAGRWASGWLDALRVIRYWPSVLDRSWLGELVYGPARRPDAAPRALAPLVVHMHPLASVRSEASVLYAPLDVLEDRHAQRGDRPPDTLEQELGLWAEVCDLPRVRSVDAMQRRGRIAAECLGGIA